MPQGNELAPARHVNWEDLLQRIALDIIEALSDNEAFMNADTTRIQCDHACRILRLERSSVIPYPKIGRILGLDRWLVKRHFKKALQHHDDLPRNGRPPILSEEEHEEMIAFIIEGYQRRRPMSIGAISYEIETRFHKSIDRNSLNHMLLHTQKLQSIWDLIS
jgi:hypothetical protein